MIHLRRVDNQILLEKFNPNHDAKGRFSSGRGGEGVTPNPAPLFGPSAERGAGDITMQSHKEQVGKTTLYVSAGVSKKTYESAKTVLKSIPAKERNNVAKVELEAGKGRTFKAGGKNFGEGAHWDPTFEKVVVFECHKKYSEKDMHFYLDHEIGHAIYDHKMGLGTFHDAYEKHDGVSAYSKAWAKEGRAGATETFAELHRMAKEGPLPKGTKQQPLFDAYSDLMAGRGH